VSVQELAESAPAELRRPPAGELPSRWSWRLARRIVLRLLRDLRGGHLEIREGAATIVLGELDPARPLRAVIEVRSLRFYRQLLRGSVGLCDSYMEGDWECENLVALVRIAALNVGGLDRLRRIFTPVLIPVQRWARWLARNTPGRSRRRIEAHYDLGNDLFMEFLDPTMMYSGASACASTSEEMTTCWRSAPGGAASRSMRPATTAAG
jgi:cyclopropane-fatty-acyl-phospholipid synthase